eukprot:2301698-Rhodomonas_salina.2
MGARYNGGRGGCGAAGRAVLVSAHTQTHRHTDTWTHRHIDTQTERVRWYLTVRVRCSQASSGDVFP